ncbi:MAG: hypothetical protein ACI845_000033 [Gammaproteobacteria bacterium]|jgi:hypothetical protein
MTDTVPLQIIGAGPAGMSLIIALCNHIAQSDRSQTGTLKARSLFDKLVMIEATDKPGGLMGKYQINANTSSKDVVQGMLEGTVFAELRELYLKLPQTSKDLIPLSEIDQLMVQPLIRIVRDLLGTRLLLNRPVKQLRIDKEKFESIDLEGNVISRSDQVVLCCGGRDDVLPELSDYAEKVEGSLQFLLRKNLTALPSGQGPVVIVGASHSAFSCAWRLLNDPLFSDNLGQREIFILQRHDAIKVRCTPEFAKQHQINYDPEADLAASTGLVYSHAGLRKDAKWLYLNIRDGLEKRVKLVNINHCSDQQGLLGQSALILQATGFKPDVPILQIDGKNVNLGKPSANGELFTLESAERIPGLYGYGLGFNILPVGKAAGEKSFRGGIHGFQSYPLVVAPQIVNNLLKE